MKEIFNDHPELNDLLKTRLQLINKKCKSIEEKTELKLAKKKLNRIFKKVEKVLYKYPLNVSMSVMTVKNLGIDVYNYTFLDDSCMIFVKKFDNLWEQIGKIINVFYNNVIVKKDNKLKKIHVVIGELHGEPRTLIMDSNSIRKFMTNKVDCWEFSNLCQTL
jgi:hypothetical protein